MNEVKGSPGQIGINPIPLDFSKFDEYDNDGKLITNDVVEYLKSHMREKYSNLPAFTVYGKQMIDNWVEKNREAEGVLETLETYLDGATKYLAVVNIDSGFFQGHRIVLKNVAIDERNQLQIDYNAANPDGSQMKELDALGYIVGNIVTYMMLEQALVEAIDQEKENRLGV